MDLKRTFCVGTWNIRGIREDGKLSEIEKVLKRRNVDELIKFGFWRLMSDLELIEGLTKNTRNYVHDGYILDVIPLTLIPLTFFWVL